MKVSAVIGANYGDEAKGLITDYLCSKSKSLVVRFNGGAQAGHTVVTPKGKRHVFHHFGSGTFASAPTFLSKHFVCHPMFFMNEYFDLFNGHGYVPKVFVDPASLVTTPWDIMLNQAAEESRGESRHGSCGMGMNETIHRSEDPDYYLSVYDLSSQYLADKLDLIRTEYLAQRADQLKITAAMPYVMDERVMTHYLDDVKRFLSKVEICDWKALELDGYDLVFEGAQGLLLDQDNKENFPHVTRSKTGVHNVLEMLEERPDLITEPVDAYYVSRTYLTRHGRGPLPNELFDKKPYLNVNDNTNAFNVHQESLRYAYLNIDTLKERILEDAKLPVRPKLALTCADQIYGKVMEYIDKEGEGWGTPVINFARMVSKAWGGKDCLISYGPHRNDVKEIQL